MPRVSIIVPVYCASEEHEGFLRETLCSVAAQSFRDCELVIVDDCSPIDIRPLVNSVADLPTVRILRNQTNLRHAKSRNVGIKAAEGQLIAFLDHDDIWLPEKLARQVETLEANPDAGMVFCDMEVFGPDAGRLRIDQRIIPERPDFYWFVRHGNFTISASAVMAKRRYLLDIGLFDSRYSTCDDFDAWLKMLLVAPIVHIPEKLAKYRLHGANTSFAVDRLNDNKLLTALIWKYWKTAPLATRLRLLPRLARKLVGRVYFAIEQRRPF